MPIIINKHTVEITHGTQKHTQTPWFVPGLRHQHYYCRALRWKSNWSPAMEMSSMLRSRCSSLEGCGGKSCTKMLVAPSGLTRQPNCCDAALKLWGTCLLKIWKLWEVSLQQHSRNILRVTFNHHFKPVSGARRIILLHQELHMLLSSQDVKKYSDHLAG